MKPRDYISLMPINSDKKLRLCRAMRKGYWRVKGGTQKYNELLDRYTFCLSPQNSYYGHEYWLRKYSGFDKDIKAVIEHGICWKCETVKVGWDVEWDIGSIITFGDSRHEVLSNLYTDYNIVRVGPRIHYAPVDQKYLQELKSQIDPSGKTMVLYPSHSLEHYKSEYDVDGFLDDAYQFAKDYRISNILVSLHPSDILHDYDKEYAVRDKKLILVSGGKDPLRFLPRIKAILSIADITYSNLVGTHTGYSVYMGKPHVINSRSEFTNNSELIKTLYNFEDEKMAAEIQKEKELFAKVFNGNNVWKINGEQYDLIDYYFGISHLKTKEELYKILDKCEILYKKRFNIK